MKNKAEQVRQDINSGKLRVHRYDDTMSCLSHQALIRK
jgi:hypothetical protein